METWPNASGAIHPMAPLLLYAAQRLNDDFQGVMAIFRTPSR